MGNINEKITIITGLIVIIPIFFTIIIYIFKFFKRIWNSLIILDSIAEQFKPNHGSSLFDKIKRIEDGLISNQQVSKLILETSILGIYQCDKDGICIWANNAILEIFGLSINEMLGNGWLISIIPEQRIKVWDYWIECNIKKIPYENQYTIYNTKLNKYFLIETIAKPCYDNEDNVIGYLGTVKIIKEIKNE